MNHPGGMKRRLENARTVLLLDEPSASARQTRRHIWDSLLKPARQRRRWNLGAW